MVFILVSFFQKTMDKNVNDLDKLPMSCGARIKKLMKTKAS